MELIEVRGGSIELSPSSSNERLILKGFHFGKYPVTHELWEEIMGINLSRFKDLDKNSPVEMVTWHNAISFCNKLSEQCALEKCYSGSWNNIKCDFSKNGYRLPTEDEWEYAARGGNQSKGYRYSGSNNLDEVGWYEDNAEDRTHSVGCKKANELGIHDMSGNVWEWCWDIGDHFVSKEEENLFRAQRGGSWLSWENECEVDSKTFSRMIDGGSNSGFRICRNLENNNSLSSELTKALKEFNARHVYKEADIDVSAILAKKEKKGKKIFSALNTKEIDDGYLFTRHDNAHWLAARLFNQWIYVRETLDFSEKIGNYLSRRKEVIDFFNYGKVFVDIYEGLERIIIDGKIREFYGEKGIRNVFLEIAKERVIASLHNDTIKK